MSLMDDLTLFCEKLGEVRTANKKIQHKTGLPGAQLVVLSFLCDGEKQTLRDIHDATFLHWFVMSHAVSVLTKEGSVIKSKSMRSITDEGLLILEKAEKEYTE